MLNRRGFLGSLAALVVAPFVPMPEPRVPVSMVRLARSFDYIEGSRSSGNPNHLGIRRGPLVLVIGGLAWFVSLLLAWGLINRDHDRLAVICGGCGCLIAGLALLWWCL